MSILGKILYIYIYDSKWISFDSDWFQNTFEREIIFESIFICFFLWIEKMHCLRKGHLNPSKNLFFLKDSENIIRPSESEFFRWIQNLYSLLKGCLNPSESEFFRCIQKLYSWPKGHLNPSESEFFRWIEKMYILVKRSLESIWHWNSFMDTGKRFCLLKPREKMLEGSTDHVFYWMITWIPYSFKCPDWFREKTWQIRSICNIFFRIPQPDCQRPIPESMST